MPLQTIVEDYVFAAMTLAKGARAENGTLILTVPDFPGIVATGADVPRCYDELYRLLEAWVQLSLERGHRLPVLRSGDGAIDFNVESNRALAGYHKRRDDGSRPEDPSILNGLDELEAAFDDLDRTV